MHRDGAQVVGEVRRADELEHHVRPAPAGRLSTASAKPSSAIGSPPSSRTSARGSVAAHDAEHARAADDADLHGALPTPPAAPCTSSVSPERRPAWLRIASWAVMNASATRAPGSSSASGTGGDAALVHEHAVGQAAAADEAEDAIARLRAEHLRAAGLDRAGDLEARNVLRPPGGAG